VKIFWKLSETIKSFHIDKYFIRHAFDVKVIEKLTKLKDKGKVVPVHTMKALRESRRIPPLILNLSARWM
jgi:hypothetical protein